MKKLISFFILITFFLSRALVAHEQVLTRAQMEDRIGGALLGSVLGDSMGRVTEPVETHERIIEKYGKEGLTSLTQIKPCDWLYEPFKHKIAAYSSNSVLALLTYQVCLQSRKEGRTDQELVIHHACNYVQLFSHDKYIHDPHYSFRKHSVGAIRSAEYLEYYLCRLDDDGKPCKKRGPRIQDNESSILARTWPIGLVFADNLEKVRLLVEKQVLLTHEHTAVLAASTAFSVGIATLIRGEPLEQAIEKMINTAYSIDQVYEKCNRGKTCTGDKLRLAQQSAVAGSLDYKGYAADEAVAIAVHIILKYREPKEALTAAVNRGGQTALIAALVGALIGAQYGYTYLKEYYETDLRFLENAGDIDAAIKDFRSVKRFANTQASHSLLKTALSSGIVLGSLSILAYYCYPFIMGGRQ